MQQDTDTELHHQPAVELDAEQGPAAQRWEVMTRQTHAAVRCVVVRRARPNRMQRAGLTAREREVVSFLSAGRSSKVAAIELKISASTVAMHVAHAARKLGVSSRLELQLQSPGRGDSAVAEQAQATMDLRQLAALLAEHELMRAARSYSPDAARPRLVYVGRASEEEELAAFTYQSAEAARTRRAVSETVSLAEAEVLLWALLSESNAAIAARLHKSRHTIANQLSQLYRKLGVSSRAEAIALCCAIEYMPPRSRGFAGDTGARERRSY